VEAIELEAMPQIFLDMTIPNLLSQRREFMQIKGHWFKESHM